MANAPPISLAIRRTVIFRLSVPWKEKSLFSTYMQGATFVFPNRGLGPGNGEIGA